MWIKICGMTTPEAVSAALEVGVDALGFVFAESSRRLTPQRAARLAQPARGRVRCVAVTRHPAQAAMDEILKVFRPDLLQTDLSDLARLQLPAGLDLLPVVRDADTVPASLPSRILFEGPVSGTGVAGDRGPARRPPRCTPLVRPGGPTTGHLAAALAAPRPLA